MNKILIALCCLVSAASFANGHGWLDVPVARSSAWRYDSRFPPYYQDQSLYCGDAGVMMNSVNKGRCGMCGEVWSEPNKLFEKGGSHYRGYIVKTYSNKDVIEAKIEFAGNHVGAFEFRLCNVDNMPNGEATQECLDKLLLTDLEGNTLIMNPNKVHNYDFPVTVKVRIPEGFTCKHCVLQWTWYTEHTCGGIPFLQCNYKTKQTFVNCADIEITGDNSSSLVTSAPGTQETTKQTTPSTTTQSTGELVQLWNQCGGINWSGPTSCIPIAVCTFINEWYSQCVPK